MILAWLAFPLVLAALGAGWGALIERASATTVADALLIPLGLAAVLAVAGILTAFRASAPAAPVVVAVGAAVGLLLAWPGRRIGGWALVAGVGVLLAYGAPVLLSGQATFTGFVRLDDTSTWFNIIDHVMAHGRSTSGEPPSTYALVFTGDVGPSYPFGAFMLPGVGRALVGVDIAWVFQPYLAFCGLALSLCLHALLGPVIASRRIRALVAFVAAQPALLYGYSLWGGIKEMTAAFLLALTVALVAATLRRRPTNWRALLPLAVAIAAFVQTLGPGAAAWIVPALLALLVGWWPRNEGPAGRRALARSLGSLAGLTAVFLIPVWLILGSFLSNKNGLFAGLFSSGQTQATKLGNLLHPLSAFQLAGIWPVGDFRFTAPTLASALLIGLAVLAALVAIAWTVRRGQLGIGLYVAVALSGSAIVYLAGGTPWVTGKTLAVSSPAVLAAGLAGGGLLWARSSGHRARGVLGALLCAALAAGALWSNVLGYGDVTLAPHARLAELQHAGKLVAGKGPTFINEYEIYADRHFLRAGAPVEPAEYREPGLPLLDGTILTKAASADLDSFPLSTLEPYESLLLRRSPVESRPPSSYDLVWRGRYYELWQHPRRPSTRVLSHVPLGESSLLPYCGVAQDGPTRPLCSVNPVATPPCGVIEALAKKAATLHAELLGYQRPEPIVARGDQTLWPAVWFHNRSEHTLSPTAPGRAVSHIAVASTQSYELWLGGSFTRALSVSVDGHHVGTVKNQLSNIGGYVPVADVTLSPGVHTFTLTYPHPNLTPGSAEHELTMLTAIALEPKRSPATEMIRVKPTDASSLCGRTLDWLEIVSRKT